MTTPRTSSRDAYFSVDIETDGPIPGPFSMLALAIVEAGCHDGHRYLPVEEPRSAYWEIAPISDQFDGEALAVNGLDRDSLRDKGERPAQAMKEAAAWINQRSAGLRPIMVASPAVFDWMFVHWYFMHFVGDSPFGHSGAFDMKTAVSVKFGRPIARSGRRNIPSWLEAPVPHTHNALDDAHEQALVFANLLAWRGPSSRIAG